ncbi:MAG: GntR family transcriptional regulator [Lentisphaeria bacterium]
MNDLSSYGTNKVIRLGQRIVAEIDRGVYPRGSQLPSQNELAAKYAVSRRTVRMAVDLLSQKNYLNKRHQREILIPETAPGGVGIAQIAFIAPALSGDTNPYLKGIEEVLDHDRFSLAIYATQSNLDQYRKMIRNVVRQQPAGVVIMTVSEELCDLHGEVLAAAGIPTVTLGQEKIPGLPCDAVRDSVDDSMAQLAAFIIEHGYQKVCFFGNEPASASQETIAALRMNLVAAGKTLPDDRLYFYPAPRGYADPPDPYSDAREHMARLLADGFRCDCLVCSHDYPAVGALAAIRDAGIAVPKKMAVLSVLQCAVEGVSPLRLTTIDSNRRQQGRKAMQLLARRLDGYREGPEIHYISTRLVEGETTLSRPADGPLALHETATRKKRTRS